MHSSSRQPQSSQLRTYVIPADTVIDEQSAFRQSETFRLAERIIVPEGVTTIGRRALHGCASLRSVEIPCSVTTIGEFAFAECHALERAEIPDSVVSVGKHAFFDCSSLVEVRLGRGVTEVCRDEFYGCTALQDIHVSDDNTALCDVDGILFDRARTTLLKMPCGRAQEAYSVPESVTTIGHCAFSQCHTLRSVHIPPSVTAIMHCAFSECTALTELCIPDSVTDIGMLAFRGCTALRSIRLPHGLPTLDISVLSHCTALRRLTIPASVRQIQPWALRGCASLERVDVAPGNDAFCDVEGILFRRDRTALLLMPEAIDMAHYAVPDGVVTLGSDAFRGCRNLRRLRLPASLRFIDLEGLDGCHRLERIEVDGANADYCDEGGILFDRTRSLLLKVPPALGLETYRVPDSVRWLGDHAFDGCATLRQVSLPESLGSIGCAAFAGCRSLREVDIPAQVREMAPFVFDGCDALQVIRCHLTDLDSLDDEDWSGFGQTVYATVELRVPAAALEAYRRHKEFGKFHRIRTIEQ